MRMDVPFALKVVLGGLATVLSLTAPPAPKAWGDASQVSTQSNSSACRLHKSNASIA